MAYKESYYQWEGDDDDLQQPAERAGGGSFAAAADFSFKVILVGNKRVGKTSITNRCVFDEFNENSQSTRVVQVVPKKI